MQSRLSTRGDSLSCLVEHYVFKQLLVLFLHQEQYAPITRRLAGHTASRDALFFCREQQLATDLGIVEVAGHALKDDGAVLESGPNLAEA